MKNSSLGKMLNTGAHALGTTVSIVALRSGGRADIDLLEEIAATRAPYLAMVGEELSPWEETRLNAKDHGG